MLQIFLPIPPSPTSPSVICSKHLGIRYKLRIKNSDIQKGKSGGYRLIYYVKTAKGIVLLTIYTKSEQVDIAADEIKYIILEYEQRAVENE